MVVFYDFQFWVKLILVCAGLGLSATGPAIKGKAFLVTYLALSALTSIAWFVWGLLLRSLTIKFDSPAYQTFSIATGLINTVAIGFLVAFITVLKSELRQRTLSQSDAAAAPKPGEGNTSGQGESAVVPHEIKRWNWGAFGFSWIWGLCNKVPIRFWVLSMIPMVSLIWIFVVGANGNEWAWKYERWESVEHFRNVQRCWACWFLGLLVVGLLIGLLQAAGGPLL